MYLSMYRLPDGAVHHAGGRDRRGAPTNGRHAGGPNEKYNNNNNNNDNNIIHNLNLNKYTKHDNTNDSGN